MIIHKLEMYNFRQYIGQQEISFSTDREKNVTVLIGVNTSGKTTIIRAFEWCLYAKNNFDDKVLLNNNVRKKMNAGDTQDVWVKVTFSHKDSAEERLYELKRKYSYTCLERRTIDGDVFVELNKKPEEELSLTYLQEDGQSKIPVKLYDIMTSINRVLPQGLSDYFFFGGERIAGIANREDLSNAVKSIMQLDDLENAIEHVKDVLKRFNSRIDVSGNQNAQKASSAIETSQKRLEEYNESKNNAQGQMDHYSEKEKEYNQELAKSSIEEVKKATKKRDEISATIKKQETKLENTIKLYVEIFNKRPYAFFGMPLIKKSLEVLQDIREETECVPDMNQNSIDYLLKRGFCICGTCLKDSGSSAYQSVMKERRKLPPETIGSVVLGYKTKTEGYLAGSELYYSDISEKYNEIRQIQRDIGDLKDEKDAQSNLIANNNNKDVKDIEEKRKQAIEKYNEAKSDYDQANQNIGREKQNLKMYEDMFKNVTEKNEKNKKTYRYINYAEAINASFKKSYEEGEKEVRSDLQKRVNENFAKMYHGRRSVTIDDKYRVKYVDVTTEESDGLKAVKSFAFIASLVAMAKEHISTDSETQVNQVYPLVMDAPFSNVDEIHIKNICDLLPKAANQVIMAVMKKDWEHAAPKLNNYVGKSYAIMKDRDSAGNEIDTLTHIKEEKSDV